jgi:hypothetical protein
MRLRAACPLVRALTNAHVLAQSRRPAALQGTKNSFHEAVLKKGARLERGGSKLLLSRGIGASLRNPLFRRFPNDERGFQDNVQSIDRFISSHFQKLFGGD